MLPIYSPGATIVIEERWRDRLWSAIPHRVVRSSPTELITHLPLGVTGIYTSNRGLPIAEGLTREQRKLVALETLVCRQVSHVLPLQMLHVFQPDRWSRVNLAWDDTGTFLGWYVNFERPATATATGLATLDLVLDILIRPDRSWVWKDADDFDEAIARGIHPADLKPRLLAEKDRVLADLDAGVGAFDSRWIDYRPETELAPPELPDLYRIGGPLWPPDSATC